MIPFLVAVGVLLLLLAALGVWVWRENRELRRAIEASEKRGAR